MPSLPHITSSSTSTSFSSSMAPFDITVNNEKNGRSNGVSKIKEDGGVEGEEEGDDLRKYIQILFLLRSLILEIQNLLLNPTTTSFGKKKKEALHCFYFFILDNFLKNFTEKKNSCTVLWRLFCTQIYTQIYTLFISFLFTLFSFFCLQQFLV